MTAFRQETHCYATPRTSQFIYRVGIIAGSPIGIEGQCLDILVMAVELGIASLPI